MDEAMIRTAIEAIKHVDDFSEEYIKTACGVGKKDAEKIIEALYRRNLVFRKYGKNAFKPWATRRVKGAVG